MFQRVHPKLKPSDIVETVAGSSEWADRYVPVSRSAVSSELDPDAFTSPPQSERGTESVATSLAQNGRAGMDAEPVSSGDRAVIRDALMSMLRERAKQKKPRLRQEESAAYASSPHGSFQDHSCPWHIRRQPSGSSLSPTKESRGMVQETLSKFTPRQKTKALGGQAEAGLGGWAWLNGSHPPQDSAKNKLNGLPSARPASTKRPTEVARQAAVSRTPQSNPRRGPATAPKELPKNERDMRILIRDLEYLLSERESELRKVKGEVGKLVKEIAVPVEDLTNKVSRLEAENEQLRARKLADDANLENLNRQLEASGKLAEERLAEIRSLQGRLEAANREREVVVDRVRALEGDLVLLRTAPSRVGIGGGGGVGTVPVGGKLPGQSDLAAKVEELREREVAAVRDDRDRALKECEVLRGRLVESEREVGRLREEVRGKEGLVESYRQRLADLHRQLHEREDRLKQELLENQSHVVELLTHLQDHDRELHDRIAKSLGGPHPYNVVDIHIDDDDDFESLRDMSSAADAQSKLGLQPSSTPRTVLTPSSLMATDYLHSFKPVSEHDFDLHRQNADLETSLQAMQSRVADSESENAALRRRLLEVEGHISAAREQSERSLHSQAEIDELRRQLKEKQQEVAGLRYQNQERDLKLRQLDLVQRDLRKEVDELRSLASISAEELGELDALRMEKSHLESRVEELERYRASVLQGERKDAEVKALKAELVSRQKEAETLREALAVSKMMDEAGVSVRDGKAAGGRVSVELDEVARLRDQVRRLGRELEEGRAVQMGLRAQVAVLRKEGPEGRVGAPTVAPTRGAAGPEAEELRRVATELAARVASEAELREENARLKEEVRTLREVNVQLREVNVQLREVVDRVAADGGQMQAADWTGQTGPAPALDVDAMLQRVIERSSGGHPGFAWAEALPGSSTLAEAGTGAQEQPQEGPTRVSVMEEQLGFLREENGALHGEVEELRARVAALTRGHESEDGLREALRNVQEERDGLQETVLTLGEEKRRLSAEVGELRAAVAALDLKSREMSASVPRPNGAAAGGTVTREQEAGEGEEAVRALREALRKVQEERDGLVREVEAMWTVNEGLRRDREEEDEMVRRLKAEIAGDGESLSVTKAASGSRRGSRDASAAVDSTLRTLQARVAELERQLDGVAGRVRPDPAKDANSTMRDDGSDSDQTDGPGAVADPATSEAGSEPPAREGEGRLGVRGPGAGPGAATGKGKGDGWGFLAVTEAVGRNPKDVSRIQQLEAELQETVGAAHRLREANHALRAEVEQLRGHAQSLQEEVRRLAKPPGPGPNTPVREIRIDMPFPRSDSSQRGFLPPSPGGSFTSPSPKAPTAPGEGNGDGQQVRELETRVRQLQDEVQWLRSVNRKLEQAVTTSTPTSAPPPDPIGRLDPTHAHNNNPPSDSTIEPSPPGHLSPAPPAVLGPETSPGRDVPAKADNGAALLDADGALTLISEALDAMLSSHVDPAQVEAAMLGSDDPFFTPPSQRSPPAEPDLVESESEGFITLKIPSAADELEKRDNRIRLLEAALSAKSSTQPLLSPVAPVPFLSLGK